MNIFVKLIDQAVSEKQLSAKIEQAKAVKIEGSPAKEVIEKIEDLLNGEESFEFVAGSNIFGETTIKLVEILDIFEKAGLNDAAYYYFIRCEEDIYVDFLAKKWYNNRTLVSSSTFRKEVKKCQVST